MKPIYAGLPPDDVLLASPAVSFWFKRALAEAGKRDVVDAYWDAEMLAAALLRRVDTALGQLGAAPKQEE